jgi:two-component system, NarL family, sensor histidine kinase UhpB
MTITLAGEMPSGIILSHNKEFNNKLVIIVNLMSAAKYDSAYFELSRLKPKVIDSEFKIAQYYVYAFESEIFYYNALFNEGLSSGYHCLRIAEELSNKLYIGSAKNLIGLNLFNLHHYSDAEKFLKEAVAEIPLLHKEVNLSYRFHAAANLCELYLALGNATDATLYAKIAMYEAKKLGEQRAISINYWNLAKAASILNEYEESTAFIYQGEKIAQRNNQQDVLLFFMTLRVENYAKQKQEFKCIEEIKRGLLFIEHDPELTAYSKVDFLKTSIKKLLVYNETVLATKARIMLDVINGELTEWRNVVQLTMLQEAHENEKKLIESEYLRKETQSQSELSTLRLYSVLIFGTLLLFISGLVVYSYVQRQNAKTSALKREAEILAATKEMEKTEERIQSANAERTRIAKELHDDLGSTVSSISLFTQMALNKTDANDEEMIRLLERVNTNATQLAETMADIIWAIYSKNDSFNNLLLRMKDFAFELLKPLNIQVQFSFPEQLQELSLNLEQRKNVYYIFKEAVNNAVKHSECSAIAIVFTKHDQLVSLGISDNGKGFDLAGVKRNNGLTNIESRAQELGGTLTITSKIDQGTHIYLAFSLT